MRFDETFLVRSKDVCICTPRMLLVSRFAPLRVRNYVVGEARQVPVYMPYIYRRPLVDENDQMWSLFRPTQQSTRYTMARQQAAAVVAHVIQRGGIPVAGDNSIVRAMHIHSEQRTQSSVPRVGSGTF